MNVIEAEQGSIVHGSENTTTSLTILSLVCSSVGIGLSAGALALLFLTATLFSEWRRNYKNQLLIQFMCARLLYTFVRYFNDIKHVFSLGVIDYVVHLDIFFMIFTESTLVAWMFIFSKQMHDSFVKVFSKENPNIWKVSLLTWLVPGITSLILYILLYLKKYSIHFYFGYILLVKWPVLIANAVFLCLVLKYILKSNITNTENNARIVLVMIVLIFVFCFQQVFLDSYKIVYVAVLHKYKMSSYYLLVSNIISLYHCAFSIIFWVFGNKYTRNLWKYRCKGLKVEKPRITNV